MLIESGGKRVLTDPGAFSTSQNSLINIDIVLITHEHRDHLHLESLNHIISNNPAALVVTNGAVGKKLTESGMEFVLLEGTSMATIAGVDLEAFDCKHEEIFEEIGRVQNTGYFIDGRLFYPGDSFGDPGKYVEILALPVAGPWCKFADAMRYAIKLKPSQVFPVHDGMLKEDMLDSLYRLGAIALKQQEIAFIPMGVGTQSTF